MKYCYDADTATLFWLEGENLLGAAMWGKGTFDTEEAFEPETWNESLAEETVNDNGRTLADVWRDALKALKED